MKALSAVCFLSVLALTACGHSQTNVYIKDYQYTDQSNLASQNRGSFQASQGVIYYTPQTDNKDKSKN